MTKLISSIKKSLALLAALLLSASAAYAAPSPIDTAAPCTLTLVCTYSGAPLSSVQVRLYRAADADAHMRFALTGAFAASGVSFDGLSDAAAFSRTASALAEYAAENKLTPTNIWQVARYNIPGLIAHESAMEGGVMKEVPDLGNPPSEWQLLDVD